MRRFSISFPPRTTGRLLDSSRAAVSDGGPAILYDGRHLPNPAVGLQHLVELGLIGLDVVVGDRPFLLVRFQRIVCVGSPGLAVDDDLAHYVSPLGIGPKKSPVIIASHGEKVKLGKGSAVGQNVAHTKTLNQAFPGVSVTRPIISSTSCVMRTAIILMFG